MSKASVVLQDVVILATNGQSNLLGSGQEVDHGGIRELVEELGVVYMSDQITRMRDYAVSNVSQL